MTGRPVKASFEYLLSLRLHDFARMKALRLLIYPIMPPTECVPISLNASCPLSHLIAACALYEIEALPSRLLHVILGDEMSTSKTE
jgi:hypothetical protein